MRMTSPEIEALIAEIKLEAARLAVLKARAKQGPLPATALLDGGLHR